MRRSLIILLTIIMFSCGEDPIPKPKAFLRLDYPEAQYVKINPDLPFTLEKNLLANDRANVKKAGDDASYGMDIEYRPLKGTIYLTYKKVNKENLMTYLRDAQNFTQKHTQKADEIIEQVYENKERKVYGMFYEVGGNAASQSQFYVTDSSDHFVTGSLYFYAKPNYDSILPAADYLKKDIQHIMETIEWVNE
ncbi:MAG: gliding motility lipoprotein GldD [Bacteroidia bacterium]|nr:gliding motility lipoprotein GldD [Bacteroidia bacterium]MBT8308720.1 gliding motility lipoprotein GldD [Bacteroidia bacterium]